MKIVIVNDDFPPHSFGGAGIIAYRHALGLKERGHQVSVLTTTQKKEENTFIEYQKIPIYSIYSEYHPRWQAYLSLSNPQTRSWFFQQIKTLQPEIVHFHNIHYHLSYHCLKLAKKAGAGTVLTFHDVMSFSYGKLDPKVFDQNVPVPHQFDYRLSWKDHWNRARLRFNPWRNSKIRKYLNFVDQRLPVSFALKEALSANGITSHTVVHNGIDLAPFETIKTEEVEAFRKRFHLEGKSVLFVGGRFGIAKGGNILKQILPRLSQKFPNILLLIAAKREGFAQKFEDELKEQGLGSHLVITGWLSQEEMRIAYQASTICLTPSICFDSFPNANLEAHAARKPVIGTCFGGTSELVQDQETGFILNPTHLEYFCEKISDLLEDPEKAKRFGERGYERVQQQFTLQHQYEKFLAIYETVRKTRS